MGKQGALTTAGKTDYILNCMGKLQAVKVLSAVAVAVLLLGHLSPVAAGMLLCIGDDKDDDCCNKPHDSHESRLDKAAQLLDASDCDCCITVEAAPPTAGTGSHKTSLDIASGTGLTCDVATFAATRNAQAAPGDDVGKHLSSLRARLQNMGNSTMRLQPSVIWRKKNLIRPIAKIFFWKKPTITSF